MLRYIAFSWNSELSEANSRAKSLARRVKTFLPNWTCGLHAPGLLVFHTGTDSDASRVYVLDRNNGLVLGRLFRRDQAIESIPRKLNFSRDETEILKQTKGEHLIDQYWGRYVAILTEDNGARVWILRDPTGAVPCFITRFRAIHIVCSHIDDCDVLRLVNPSINWDHVAAYLWFDHLVTSETGLSEVHEVNAGKRIEISPGGIKSDYVWHPDRFCRKTFVGDRQMAGKELRSVIEYCASTWASCYRSILLELSGGLDSSIVLSCLSRTAYTSSIVCENLLTRNAESDERIFAREAAHAAHVELIETQIPSSDRPLDSFFDPTRVATPAHTVFLPETQSIKELLVTTRGIDAIFSGQGGDHFFQRNKQPHIAAEYARRYGLRGELFRVISDTSRFTNRPFWSVLATAVVYGLFRKHASPYDILKPPPLVSRETLDAFNCDAIRHPWVNAARDLPGSKQQQIFNVIDCQVFRHMPGHYADIVHPLISQPIIELCLQIPSYILTYGGIDRALVRDAFAGLVPASILGRTTKGATTGYFINLLVRNTSVLREFLLGGILVSQGLLSKHTTAEALTERSLIRNHNALFPVLIAFRAEIWARSWASSGHLATR